MVEVREASAAVRALPGPFSLSRTGISGDGLSGGGGGVLTGGGGVDEAAGHVSRRTGGGLGAEAADHEGVGAADGSDGSDGSGAHIVWRVPSEGCRQCAKDTGSPSSTI